MLMTFRPVLRIEDVAVRFTHRNTDVAVDGVDIGSDGSEPRGLKP
jgi:hypothetical protein